MNTIISYIYCRIIYAHSMESPSDTDIPFVFVIIFGSTYIMAFLLYTLLKQTNCNMKQIISFTLFSLLFARTSAATLDTTLVGGNGNAGNMFDLCAKTHLEITSLDINCGSTGSFTIEIYIATAINESYALINADSSSWTPIHQQTATCQPTGTLTVLNAFNNSIPAQINNGDCRGFYVTQTTGSLKYTNGVSVGSVFASNADLDFKEGIGLGYPFGGTNSPRVWNGRIHYNAATDAPTTATPTSQTANPTTATPTLQTTNPTLQPTSQTSTPTTSTPTSQSSAPTLPTTNPTQQPTTSISLCATTPYPTWCYYVDLYPTHSDTTTTVNITDIDRASDVFFNIVFTPRGQSCIDPSVTFEYEQIDIAATSEYIDIMDNEGSTIQQCQGNGGADSQCNVWWTCVSNYSLGVPQINAEAPYQIQLMASSEMNDLCPTTLATNARLHFQCKGTESPTMDPTFDPSAAPSTQTLAPTTNPTMAPTSPTLVPSVPPTLAPTNPISLCATTPYPTWCYYIDVYPQNAITTTTVNITDTGRGTDVYFNIIFTPRGQLCDNPSISFEYEQIDIALNTEHIDIRNDIGILLSQCQGNGGADRQCDVWWACLSNYNLGITQIDPDTPYRIQLMTTSTNDTLCHHLVTNAKLHFSCDGTVSPTMDPTFDPTVEPTLSTLAPTTMAPTTPTTNPSTDPSTTNPSQNPSTAPTNIASGNVLSTNITAFQSPNEYGKGKGNSNKEIIWIFISILSVIACINIVCAAFYFINKRKRLVAKNITNYIIGGETMEDTNIGNIKGGKECGIELEAVHSGNGPEISDDSGEDLYSHNYKSAIKDETETPGNALTIQTRLTVNKTDDGNTVTDEGVI